MNKSYAYDNDGKWQSGFNVKSKEPPKPANEIVRTITESYVIPETGELIRLSPHQIRILNHCFTEVKFPGEKEKRLPYRTVVYSAPKKSGKTEVSGAVTYAWSRVYGGEMLSIANDKDQAKERMFSRVEKMIGWLKQHDPERYKREIVTQDVDYIEFRNPHTEFKAIPCDPYGEAGGHYSLTVWDELWAYGRTETTWKLWAELQPVPTVKNSMRFVTTYAGWYGESEVLWSIYEQVVQPDDNGNPHGEKVPGLEDLPCYRFGSTFVYWDHECRMRWQTDTFLEEARLDPVMRKRQSEYLRLWENRWTTGTEAFLDMNLFDKAVEAGKQFNIHRAGIL